MAHPPQPSPLDEHLRRLVIRAFRTLLHRLRGLRSLLGGWVEVGVPPGSEARVPALLQEDIALLARLDWIGTLLMYPPPLERMEGGEAPTVLLAVALGLGSPEEARARLPQIVEPRAAVAAAIWLQLRVPDGVLDREVRMDWEGRSLTLAVESAAESDDTAAWSAAYGDLLLLQESKRIVFRPGCFAPHVAVGAASEQSN